MSDTSGEPIAAGVRRVLSVRGAMSEDDLLSALKADGVDLGPEPRVVLAEVLDRDSEPFMPLAEGRWVWLPGLLEGRIFTHRLSEVEAAHDIIIGLDCDLAPLEMLTEYEAYQRLSDGSPITVVCSFDEGEEVGDSDVLTERGVAPTAFDNDTELLVLPAGRLAALGVGAGDLVGLRAGEHGFELVPVREPGPCDVATMLAGLLDQHPDRPEMLDVAVWTVCADDDSLFRQAAPPLGELLSASGLACEGEWVAGSGFDFAAWRVAGRIETVKERYQLDDDEALAVLATVRLYKHTRDLVEAVMAAHDSGDENGEHELTSIDLQLPSGLDPTPIQAQERDRDRKTVGAALEVLADPAVAVAVLAEIDFDHDRRSDIALGVFAESAEPLAPRVARPALRWLRATAHERLGDIEEAEACLLAAESLDPDWPVTLFDLARYASDRGDAERGLSLLRRAGAPADHQLVELLEHFRPTPRPGLGRNDRCWCGSGRKYKACHLHREQLPLEERAAWLYQKAGSTLLLAGSHGPFSSLLMEAGAARARSWDPDAVARALDDGLACDVVLFEGGAFADFLATRGSLLPDDERLLAGQWLLVQRSVHEVLSVSPGRGFTLRDVRTGDVQQVRERAASTQVKVGQLLCGRVVPAGETMQIFGGMEPVSLGERDELIALLDNDPDPVELVAALSRRFAPPVLQNTEGESLMICDATLRVDNPVALAQALDEAYDRDDDQTDGTLGWYEHVITHGMQRIRAHLELCGDQLHLHANSAARFERVLATVRALDSSVTVLNETREPAGDVRAVQQLAARNPATPAQSLDPATDPDIAAILDDVVRKYEVSWLDEPIPALANHTPRQCADDPTRRPDLIRLLDSFPQDNDRPGAMSPRRLRAALGLN
ncbi:SEC-C metal-binding domain-containing protein [Mycobacterium sp.]|uniref:SEC-C metal-binding domain-containing protein n=1 Tax=Mycobacterium sp. TaxID=1785 RepID=UPI003C78FFA1